ncbi:MAG: hypothetical protein ACOC4S_01870 [Balneolaceae bacterium]
MKNKKNGKRTGLVIDESNHASAPTTLQLIKHVLMAAVMGVVFAQVILFAFRMGSVVIYFWLYTEWVVAYLLVCAVLGWFYGDKFIQSLGKEGENWWNLWNDWKT